MLSLVMWKHDEACGVIFAALWDQCGNGVTT